MADGIKISIDNLDVVIKKLQELPALVEKELTKILDKRSQEIATKAKQNADSSTDTGILKNTISVSYGIQNRLTRFINVNAPYAAFVEFGTGKFASDEVSKLPADWQSYAAQFRGLKGPGTFDDLVIIIKKWLKDKGIDVFNREQEFDSESGNVIQKKQRHSKDEKERAYDQAAYLIARKIVVEGIKAQPYLFPAYKDVVPKIQDDVKNLFNQ